MSRVDLIPQVRVALPVAAVQAALDASPGHLAALDQVGRLVAVNQAWRDFMVANGGHEAECGVGANYLRVCEGAAGLCGDEGQAVAAGLRAVLSGERGSFELEYPCHGPSDERWYVVRARPFVSQGQRYAMVAHEDVTARRQTDIRAADVDTEVARALRARTQSLRQENDELDAFIGAVSHDLRTPVRHLQGFLGLLRRRANPRLSDDDLRLLDVLDGSAGRLSAMIEELLGLARVSQSELQLREVDLTQVVLRAWNHMAPETQGRDIEWVAGDLPTVRGDPELLCLAFENLLSNAIKYTSGRARAKIEVGARDGDREWTVFVQDDGVGFDSRYVSRLFGAFQRLHSDRDFAGIGMGLANVKRIVARHGGRVWAESHPGDGATFYISFPKP